MALVTLAQGATTHTVKCTNVVVGAKRNINATPNANIDGPVEVQTMAYENMKISLQGVHFNTAISTLDQTDLNTIITTKYDGTNPWYLTVKYGPIGSEQILQALSGETVIPVVLESYNMPISTTDSRDAYMPVGSLSFIETTPTS